MSDQTVKVIITKYSIAGHKWIPWAERRRPVIKVTAKRIYVRDFGTKIFDRVTGQEIVSKDIRIHAMFSHSIDINSLRG